MTRPTLLLRIRDHADDAAWGEFVEIYTPLIYNFATKKGIAHADAADVVQNVMRSVATAISGFNYDPTLGTFRSWLYTVTRNQINSFYRHRGRRPQGDGSTAVLAVAEIQQAEADGDADAQMWETDYRRQLFQWASGAVKEEFNPRIWEAFWRTAVGDEDAVEVADSLGMTRPAVYVAKCRCISRIREKIASAAGERWEQKAAEETP